MKFCFQTAALTSAIILTGVFFMNCSKGAAKGGSSTQYPLVVFETNMGEIVIEVYPEEAPVSVQNFTKYVEDGFYDGTIFHRVIDGFVIQGGGFDMQMNRKETRPPIENEAHNGLKNLRGTLSYARTNVVNSATSQFFINLKDNASLDHRNRSDAGYGYAVFGKVVRGMAAVDAIAKISTGEKMGMSDVPEKDVFITRTYIRDSQ